MICDIKYILVGFVINLFMMRHTLYGCFAGGDNTSRRRLRVHELASVCYGNTTWEEMEQADEPVQKPQMAKYIV